ncbi:formyltransferase family protein [Pelagibacteraceae bacterium]|jgi:methionyl-tRNA formyltransferase|nr:formyltransferase family protein [Pelagibacteraceae bacterium]
MKKKCLFLGYNSKKTKLIKKIKKIYKNSWYLKNFSRKLEVKDIKDIDLIICFGYRHVVKKNLLKIIKAPIINLHISFLPFNKGSHPNFWSFMEGTKSGVTIHRIEEKIDKGKILFQKEIKFNLNKNKKKLTFENTYRMLKTEIENLFLKNIKNIFQNNLTGFYPNIKGTFHKKKDLPKLLANWKQNIFKTKKIYLKTKYKTIQKH